MSSDSHAPAAAPQVRLLGPPQVVTADGRRVPLERRDAAVLAYLAVEGEASRQRVVELLWPESPPEAARNALRQRLFQLRKRCGAELVQGAEVLTLDARAGVDLRDLEERAHDEAAAPLLDGCDYGDYRLFNEWLGVARARTGDRQRAAVAAAAERAEQQGRLADAIAIAERLIASDPLQEHAHRRLMRLHYLRGDRAAALAAFDRCERVLKDELSARPGAETLALLKTIETGATAASLVPATRRAPIPPSVLRPPRLVGRTRELDAMRGAWESGRVFMLVGEAGMGKTRLLGEFAALDGGALHVQARPGDSGIPFASMARLLRALLERAPAAAQSAPRRELARVLPEFGDTGAIVPAAAAGRLIALQQGIESLLRLAGDGGVRAILFDDMHFADEASVEMVLALLASDAGACQCWGLAQRAAEGGAAARAQRDGLVEASRLELLPLAPLDEAQLRELVDSLGMDGVDGARLAPLLARHTGGNPMYALETIKHLIVSGGAGADHGLPRPANVGQLIEHRLRQLPAQSLALARVAAVAGVDFSIELAEAVLATHALALADAWSELEAAQILRGNAFAHDLVHEATLAGVPAPIAARTHAAVAAFLEARGGEPARIASHWLDAGQPRRALVALHAAADAARRAMRRKEEAAFLERAASIEAEAGEPAAFETWRAAVSAQWAADYKAVDTALIDRYEAAARTPAQRAAVLSFRAGWAHAQGDLAASRRLCHAAIELAEAAGDETIAAEARMRVADILQFEGDLDGALTQLQALLPWAAERASDQDRSVCYGTLALVLDGADRGREARIYHQRSLDASRKAKLWSEVVTQLGNLAMSWAMSGYPQRSVELLREGMQLAAAHDEAHGCGAALPSEMYRSLRDSARYAEAQRWMDPALAAEPEIYVPLLRCHFACGWLHVGQNARAQREIDAVLAAQPTELVRAKALQMHARLKLALGRHDAGPLLEEALQLVLGTAGRRGFRASIRLDRALTLDPAAALAVAREVIAEAERFDYPGVALAGHVRAARFAADAGAGADAVAHAGAALAVADEVAPNDLYPGERWLNAWRALRVAGREAEARDVLARGATWVRDTMQAHVPEPFRDGFARANLVNRELLRAAEGAGLA